MHHQPKWLSDVLLDVQFAIESFVISQELSGQTTQKRLVKAGLTNIFKCCATQVNFNLGIFKKIQKEKKYQLCSV